MKIKKNCVWLFLLFSFSVKAATELPLADQAKIALKVPGNYAKTYLLNYEDLGDGRQQGKTATELPVSIVRKVTEKDGKYEIQVTLKALDKVYFSYGETLNTAWNHSENLFLMPGFWYRKNLRSPKEAPSFHSSDSWLVRDDRLSSPLTAVYNSKAGKAVSVLHKDNFDHEALTTHKEGEVIISGQTSLGYVGFENQDGKSLLSFGFPYREAPKSYLRKLTLAPAIQTFQKLDKGKTISLTWEVAVHEAKDYAECVQHIWEYCYDTNRPQPLKSFYTVDKMKKTLSNFFVESYVDNTPTHYYSGVGLETSTCAPNDVAEVGFVGRILLNAYNALEYGVQCHRSDLVKNAYSIFDSYLKNGFTDQGFFNEVVHFKSGFKETRYSIRRQSEAVYAVLHFLNYEKQQGRKHPEWEKRMQKILDNFLRLQKEDGSFPRKFENDFSLVDPTGGSTPSVTLPLVMASKYFKEKRYLESAKRTVDYLEKEIISKSDYFSSTLDANCEDKEASIYSATAAYYLALVTKGKEQAHYASLAKKAAYFALSWYYTWDVPFAEGQMLGDVGLKTRGWGNVSVENNHIDVFVFELGDVLNWLAKYYDEPRFSDFVKVISSSMRQLLPFEGHMCNIGKVGFYPEVVQHTNWDYGRNGKGFYNNIFAPGWTVASLWELLTPGRAENFLSRK